ncbi:MAG: ABC transporter ATP-binding protein [Chloroflexi bacterium]|nr:ABC transporter ATP-binding protein [Chloroflexota bacterium]
MTQIAVRVEGLGKEYRIGEVRDTYVTLRNRLAQAFRAPARRTRRLLRGEAAGAADLTQSFWALRNVSFEVERGAAIGVIGRNGAGKSTLLKILSRITEPSEGYAEVYGRVGALLEVGTGFHQELTGRENVYLNGAILGMTQREVSRKFDEIVAFAEIDKFVDTPIKHYSSGMRLRLGFAVAAHLEPEILIVDEVLAVGDVAFQRKCLGKMGEVASSGRTVIFVSHNMATIASVTENCIVLDKGAVAYVGPTDTAITRYMDEQKSIVADDGTIDLRDAERHKETGRTAIRFKSLRILDSDARPCTSVFENEPMIFEVGFVLNEPVEYAQVGLGISGFLDSTALFFVPSPEYRHLEPGREYHVQLTVDPNYLAPATYRVKLGMFADGRRQDAIMDAASITILPPPSGYANAAYLKPWTRSHLRLNYQWTEPERDLVP